MTLSIILNVLTVATGVVWLMDVFVMNPKRRHGLVEALAEQGAKVAPKSSKKVQVAEKQEPVYVEYSKAFFPLLLIIFMFRNFTESVDYGLVLVIATTVTGIIWLIDKLAFESKRKQKLLELQKKHPKISEEILSNLNQDPLVVEYAKSFFPVILLILFLRSFLFEPFKIPSGSMKPTLEVGDFVLVNKFNYGIRLPVTNKKILSFREPERGEVFVFRYPGDPRLDYIKRVIGLPGDTIIYQDKQIYIQPACSAVVTDCPKLQKVESKLLERNGYLDTKGYRLDRFEEQIFGVKHQILHDPSIPDYRLTMEFNQQCMQGRNQWKVPEGHYFAMGDNREHSADSRFWCFVPEENLVGRAVAIWMHWNWDEKYKIDLTRIGSID